MMETIDYIKLWKEYDLKLENTISLNKRLIGEIQQQKAKSALRRARNFKGWTLLHGLIYSGLIIYFMYYIYSSASVFALVSIAIHLVVTITAVGMYVHQLSLIRQIDCSESIVMMQEKLAKLKVSTINVIALCFLQLPVFVTCSFSMKFITEHPLAFWFVQIPLALLFTFAGIWLFKNVDIKNKDKKWFKLMFHGSDWQSIIKSDEYLKELDQFRND